MALHLTITSYQRLSPGQSRSKTLEQGRLTLGRAPDNDWVLSDPEMVLSKNHCTIDYRDDGYYITDTSTNGVFLNHSEQRLGRGNSAKINDQDLISLGDYEISVQLGEGLADVPASSLGHAGGDELIGPEWTGQNDIAASANAKAEPDEIALPASVDEEDPLGLGLGAQEGQNEPSWGQYSEPDHLPSDREFFQPPRAVRDKSLPQQGESREKLDEPFDSLGLPVTPKQNAAAATPAKAIPDDWEDSLIQRLIKDEDSPAARQQEPQSGFTDDSLAEGPEPQIESFEQQQPESPPQLTPEQDSPAEASLDPFADLEKNADVEPGSFTERIPVFEDSANSPEAAGAESSEPIAKPTGASRSGPLAAGTYAQAVQAFLQGAGMPGTAMSEADALALLQRIGQIFRCTAQGMMELLRARGNVKNEFHLERTMVGPIENNPLKILPTVDEAMSAMLLRKDQTWIPADRAIDEGFADLRAHELAFMAGMQAALKHLLETFDPVQLEQALGQHSAWSNILAGGRKARHWDAFTALYGKIASKAEDDFQDLFRKEFARAYQVQLQKLRQRRET